MEDSSKKTAFFGWRMVAIALFADFCVVGFAFQSYPVIQLVLAEEWNFLDSWLPLPYPVSCLFLLSPCQSLENYWIPIRLDQY